MTTRTPLATPAPASSQQAAGSSPGKAPRNKLVTLASDVRAVLGGPLEYEVSSGAKRVGIYKAPSSGSSLRGYLKEGITVSGFPAGRWLRLDDGEVEQCGMDEGTASDSDSAEEDLSDEEIGTATDEVAFWSPIERSQMPGPALLIARWAVPVVSATFLEALKIEWPGIDAEFVTYTVLWKPCDNTDNLEDGSGSQSGASDDESSSSIGEDSCCNSVECTSSCAHIDGLPAGQRIWLRIIAYISSPEVDFAELSVSGSWTELETAARSGPSEVSDCGVGVDSCGRYRGIGVGINCRGFISGSCELCSRCGGLADDHEELNEAQAEQMLHDCEAAKDGEKDFPVASNFDGNAEDAGQHGSFFPEYLQTGTDVEGDEGKDAAAEDNVAAEHDHVLFGSASPEGGELDGFGEELDGFGELGDTQDEEMMVVGGEASDVYLPSMVNLQEASLEADDSMDQSALDLTSDVVEPLATQALSEVQYQFLPSVASWCLPTPVPLLKGCKLSHADEEVLEEAYAPELPFEDVSGAVVDEEETIGEGEPPTEGYEASVGVSTPTAASISSAGVSPEVLISAAKVMKEVFLDPFCYRVLAQAPVYEEPCYESRQIRTLEAGAFVYGVPGSSAWVQLQKPYPDAWVPVRECRQTALPGKRVLFLRPYWAEIKVQEAFTEALDIAWNGVPATRSGIRAAYSVEWREAPTDTSSPGSHHKLSLQPNTLLHGLPSGAAVQLRVAVRVCNTKESTTARDVSMTGPWQDFTTQVDSIAPEDMDRQHLDPFGVTRGSCEASQCSRYLADWDYLRSAPTGVSMNLQVEKARCRRCGQKFLAHCRVDEAAATAEVETSSGSQRSAKSKGRAGSSKPADSSQPKPLTTLSSHEWSGASGPSASQFEVAHKLMYIRRAPSSDAAKAGILKQGTLISGEEVGNWVRLDSASLQRCTSLTPGEPASDPGWAMINGSSLGLGQLLKRKPSIHASRSAAIIPQTRSLQGALNANVQVPVPFIATPSRYIVQHKLVFVRDKPSVSADRVGQLLEGSHVTGWEVDGWICLDRPSMLEHSITKSQSAWVLVDGGSLGLGPLLRRVVPQASQPPGLSKDGAQASSGETQNLELPSPPPLPTELDDAQDVESLPPVEETDLAPEEMPPPNKADPLQSASDSPREEVCATGKEDATGGAALIDSEAAVSRAEAESEAETVNAGKKNEDAPITAASEPTAEANEAEREARKMLEERALELRDSVLRGARAARRVLSRPLEYEVVKSAPVYQEPLPQARHTTQVRQNKILHGFPGSVAWVQLASHAQRGASTGWVPVREMGVGLDRQLVLSARWSSMWVVKRTTSQLEVAWNGVPPPAKPYTAGYSVEWRHLDASENSTEQLAAGRTTARRTQAVLHGLPAASVVQLRVLVRISSDEPQGFDFRLTGPWRDFRTIGASEPAEAPPDPCDGPGHISPPANQSKSQQEEPTETHIEVNGKDAQRFLVVNMAVLVRPTPSCTEVDSKLGILRKGQMVYGHLIDGWVKLLKSEHCKIVLPAGAESDELRANSAWVLAKHPTLGSLLRACHRGKDEDAEDLDEPDPPPGWFPEDVFHKPVRYEVMHANVVIRRKASLHARYLGILRQGEHILGWPRGNWLQLVERGKHAVKGWAMIDGSEIGFGTLLQPVFGDIQPVRTFAEAVHVRFEPLPAKKVVYSIEWAQEATPDTIRLAATGIVGTEAALRNLPGQTAFRARVVARTIVPGTDGNLPCNIYAVVVGPWTFLKTGDRIAYQDVHLCHDPLSRKRGGCRVCHCPGFILGKFSYLHEINEVPCRRCGCSCTQHVLLEERPEPPKFKPKQANFAGAERKFGISGVEVKAWSPEDSEAGADVTRYVISKVKAAKNHYEVLGVSPSATPKEVRSAYRLISLKIHPDKVIAGDKDNDLKSIAESTFKRVAAAYEVLGDHGKRATYECTVRAEASKNSKGTAAAASQRQASKGAGFAHQQPGRHPGCSAPKAEPQKVAVCVRHGIHDEEVLLVVNQGHSAYFLKQALASRVRRGPWHRIELAFASGAPVPESYQFGQDETIFAMGLRLGPPQDVKVKLVHASSEMTSYVVVKDTSTIAEVRSKIVEDFHFERKRVLLGERGRAERSFVKFADSEFLNGRRELLINGVDNVVQLTLEEGIRLQDELIEAFAESDFQKGLDALLDQYGQPPECLADMTFRQEFGALVRKAQTKVLPKWGFVGERAATLMLVAFQGIGSTDGVMQRSLTIDKWLKVTYMGNLPAPLRKPKAARVVRDKGSTSRRERAKEHPNKMAATEKEPGTEGSKPDASTAKQKQADVLPPAELVTVKIRQAVCDDKDTPGGVLEITVPSDATFKLLREAVTDALGLRGSKESRPRVVKPYGRRKKDSEDDQASTTFMGYADTDTIKGRREFLIMGATIPASIGEGEVRRAAAVASLSQRVSEAGARTEGGAAPDSKEALVSIKELTGLREVQLRIFAAAPVREVKIALAKRLQRRDIMEGTSLMQRTRDGAWVQLPEDMPLGRERQVHLRGAELVHKNLQTYLADGKGQVHLQASTPRVANLDSITIFVTHFQYGDEVKLSVPADATLDTVQMELSKHLGKAAVRKGRMGTMQDNGEFFELPSGTKAMYRPHLLFNGVAFAGAPPPLPLKVTVEEVFQEEQSELAQKTMSLSLVEVLLQSVEDPDHEVRIWVAVDTTFAGLKAAAAAKLNISGGVFEGKLVAPDAAGTLKELPDDAPIESRRLVLASDVNLPLRSGSNYRQALATRGDHMVDATFVARAEQLLDELELALQDGKFQRDLQDAQLALSSEQDVERRSQHLQVFLATALPDIWNAVLLRYGLQSEEDGFDDLISAVSAASPHSRLVREKALHLEQKLLMHPGEFFATPTAEKAGFKEDLGSLAPAAMENVTKVREMLSKMQDVIALGVKSETFASVTRATVGMFFSIMVSSLVAEYGFESDRHGFDRMFSWVFSHKDDAEVQRLANSVEQLLQLPIGSWFAITPPTKLETVEVVVYNAHDATQEVKVEVSSTSTLAEVILFVSEIVDCPEALTEARIVSDVKGDWVPLPNSDVLAGRTRLAIDGINLHRRPTPSQDAGKELQEEAVCDTQRQKNAKIDEAGKQGSEVAKPMLDIKVCSPDDKWDIHVSCPQGTTVGYLKGKIIEEYNGHMQAAHIHVARRWSRTFFLPYQDEDSLAEVEVVYALGLDVAGIQQRKIADERLKASSVGEPEAEPA